MALAQRSAEFQLALYPGGGAQYVRHRDAFPDDGSEEHMRRVRVCYKCSCLLAWTPPPSPLQVSLSSAGCLHRAVDGLPTHVDTEYPAWLCR